MAKDVLVEFGLKYLKIMSKRKEMSMRHWQNGRI